MTSNFEDLDHSGRLFCTSCQVYIEEPSRGAHYQTDWHRYNVKRRSVGLPSVTEEQFNTKLEELKALKDAENVSFRCEVCRKTFKNSKAHEQHLLSNKHKKMAAKTKTVSDAGAGMEEVKDAPSPLLASSSEVPSSNVDETHDDEEELVVEEPDESQAIPLQTCLFCSHESSDMASYLSHMLKKHGFFIPFSEYLTDLEGLLEYLGAKVGVGHVCLYCNHRGKWAYKSKHAVQNHMIDTSHCKIRFEEDPDDEEFIDFYDFPAHLYADADDDSDKKRGAVRPAGKRRPAGINDVGELILSDGTSLGHRALVSYYRQSLRPESESSAQIRTMLSQHGSQGMALPAWAHRANGRSLRTQHKQRDLVFKNQMSHEMKANNKKFFRKQMDC